MNECCEWHWALLAAREASKQERRWLREKGSWYAALKLAKFYSYRPVAIERAKKWSTWSTAFNGIRRLSSSRRRKRNNPWANKLSNLAANRNKLRAVVDSRVSGSGPCPSCKAALRPSTERAEPWANRLVVMHKARLVRQQRPDWDRKLEGIAKGASRRPPSVARPSTLNKANTWRAGLRHAIQRCKNKCKWQQIQPWDRWCSNAATNIAKRARFRAAKRAGDSHQP